MILLYQLVTFTPPTINYVELVSDIMLLYYIIQTRYIIYILTIYYLWSLHLPFPQSADLWAKDLCASSRTPTNKTRPLGKDWMKFTKAWDRRCRCSQVPVVCLFVRTQPNNHEVKVQTLLILNM